MTMIGYQMKTITDKIKGSGDRELKRQGITLPQSFVLLYLAEHGGSSTQKDLEIGMGVSHATISGIVTRMENGGFLHCYPDSADRRNKIVEMTDKARRNSKEMHSSIAAHEKMLLKGLTGEEIKELERMLAVISDNVLKSLET